MVPKALGKFFLSIIFTSALACSWSGSVFADGGVAALEARIAELEKLVHQLLQNQAKPATSAATVDTGAEEAVEAKAVALLDKHEKAVAEETHKHSYKFGGFIKADVIYSDYDSGPYSGPGRDFYIAVTTPVGDGPGESYLDFHAKESRINFKSTHNLDNGAKIGTFLEMDFMMSAQGNERVSNSFSPRLRHAYVTYNKWLFGQTWMTFFNLAAVPENLDFVGPTESAVFGRQVVIKYTNGPWQVALENPETTITPYGGGPRITTDDNTVPDAVLRYNMKGDWGSFTAAGIYRQMSYTNNTAGIDDSTYGYGISLSGKFVFDNQDDFRWMVNTGSGMGRYMGLNIANGAVLDEHGNLHAIDSTSAFGSYRHLWSNKWRSNLTYGYGSIDNDTDLTGMGVTKTAHSYHLNLIYSPLPKLDIGAELIWAEREIESGDDGEMKRLQFSAKYAY